MAVPVPWVCTKCGKRIMRGSNPNSAGSTYGKCPKSADKKHSWRRD